MRTATKTYKYQNGERVHRTVAAQKIGRSIRKGEHVHHINGNIYDNRPENLQIMPAGEHIRLHNQKAEKLPKLCKQCGIKFYPNRKDGHKLGPKQWNQIRFCSKKCVGLSRRIHLNPKPCFCCGKIMFPKNGSIFNWNRKKYCSRHCFGIVVIKSVNQKIKDRKRREASPS